MRRSEELKATANREAFACLYKSVVCNKDGRCAICGWHKGENRVNYRKHGVRKPRKKDHRLRNEHHGDTTRMDREKSNHGFTNRKSKLADCSAFG